MVPVKELNEMRAYFESGITLKADFRKMQLKNGSRYWRKTNRNLQGLVVLI
jgi:hypothetical protein